MNKSVLLFFVALISGLALGAAIVKLVDKNKTTEPAQKQPIYWVAPMDPNYRRNEPGKSPMGMDLIPVYEDKTAQEPGKIYISPEVRHNLGVRTGLAEIRELENKVKTVGFVKYDENRLIHIHPRLSGWVEKLFVKATGDPVTKGAPLYSLYSPELVNAQEELILAISRNNMRLINSTEERLRALQVNEEFIQRLKQTEKVRRTVTFYAPQNGVVDNLAIREGFYVEPGTTLFSIGALDKIWVEAEVFERQASIIKTNDPVLMTLDYAPNKQWQGKVDYIYPTVDNNTRTLRLRLAFENADETLKPNMYTNVSILTKSQETLVIPREALIQTGVQDRVVLALGDGYFKSVSVKAGRRSQSHVEIIEGLEEGDSIVLSAQFLLDSESSKTSDFMRMHSIQEGAEEPTEVWVNGIVKQRLEETRAVIVWHNAIDAWGWPPMTMEFSVDENVDFESLNPDTHLHMQISETMEGEFTISEVHIQQNHHQEDHDNTLDNTAHGGMHHD